MKVIRSLGLAQLRGCTSVTEVVASRCEVSRGNPCATHIQHSFLHMPGVGATGLKGIAPSKHQSSLPVTRHHNDPGEKRGEETYKWIHWALKQVLTPTTPHSPLFWPPPFRDPWLSQGLTGRGTLLAAQFPQQKPVVKILREICTLFSSRNTGNWVNCQVLYISAEGTSVSTQGKGVKSQYKLKMLFNQ